MTDGAWGSVLFVLGAVLAAPVFFAIGLFFGIDRSIKHERADISAALRRSR